MTNPMQTHGAPSWIGHSGPDNVAARKFYEDVLGWNVIDMPMQDGSSYAGIMVGESPVGGFNPQPSPDGAWTIFVTVDDVDARYRKALDAGATSAGEPMDMPGVGRMATITDPQGASIALITYESMQG